MINLLLASALGLVVSISLTAVLMRRQARMRDATPRSTGGASLIAGTWAGFLGVLLTQAIRRGDGQSTAAAWLLLGFLTVVSVVAHLQERLSRTRTPRIVARFRITLTTVGAVGFGVGAYFLRSSETISITSNVVKPLPSFDYFTLGPVVFVLIVVAVNQFWMQAVNTTSAAVEGVVSGSAAPVVGVYVLICALKSPYSVTYGLLDAGVVAAAAFGSLIGFIWWNAHPSKAYLGKPGGTEISALIVGLSVITQTEFVALIIGGVFAMEFASLGIQYLALKVGKVKVFTTAPLSQHLSDVGWTDSTILVRYWLLAGISAAVGCGIVYAGGI